MNAAETRDNIFAAALRHVAFDGWSERAIDKGAKDAGAAPEALDQLYPHGVADLVDDFSRWADQAMLNALAARDSSELKTRERVAIAIRLRLETLAPHREAVRRLNAHFSLPMNAPHALRLVARTVDAIWYAAGDHATDFSYYTKRATLGAVYSATVLYWLADESENATATWTFLDRRLDDIMRLPRFRGELAGVLDRLPNPVRLFRLARRRRPV